MRYAQIREYDVANGPGIRTSIFVSGCSHKCHNCFNEEYQDFSYGQEWTKDQTELVIKYLKNPQISGLTLLGGEPMQNFELIEVIKEIKEAVDKSIWIYSGYRLEEILSHPRRRALLEECDVLVDGLFIEELKDLKLKFRGSSNQRIIDIKKTLENKEVVIYDL